MMWVKCSMHCRFAVVQEMAIYWADQMSSVVYESGEVNNYVHSSHQKLLV